MHYLQILNNACYLYGLRIFSDQHCITIHYITLKIQVFNFIKLRIDHTIVKIFEGYGKHYLPLTG